MFFRSLIFILLAGGMVRAEDSAGVVAHWKLDGDVRDTSPHAHDGKLVGRCQFVDSPVAGPGKALWCNGVDSAVRVEGLPDRAGGDLSVSAWICPLESRAGGILGRTDGQQGWSIEMLANNSIQFRVGTKTIGTTPGRVGFGQWYHVAAVFGHGGKIALYVNGAVAGSIDAGAESAASALPLLMGCTSEKGPFFTGLIDEVELYDRAIGADDVANLTDAGLPWLRARPSAQTPFAGHFSLEEDDVVVLVGGEDQNASQSAGYLETILTTGAAGKHVLFRDMAWEGDTVFEQWRILNFGPWPRQFERVGASVFFVQFGQMESFKGKSGVEEFAAAYDRLLDEFQQRTRRIVIVSPTPFQKSAAPLPDLTAHNDDLKLYAEAAKKLAEKRGLLYVDLFTPLQQPQYAHRLTRDGAHLTDFGHWIAARETSRQLGFSATDPVTDDEHPKFERNELEQIRTDVRDKNALWVRYWRPTNWAFLNGDRITQPSSRDYLDSRIRWQPAEVQEYAPMIAKDEVKIAEEVKKMQTP